MVRKDEHVGYEIKIFRDLQEYTDTLKQLSDEGVEIEYMYSFNNGDVAKVIIKTIDMEACHRILIENDVTLLTDEQMYSL